MVGTRSDGPQPLKPKAAAGNGLAAPLATLSGLGRLGAWCYDHRRRVLVAWIVGVIAVIAVGTSLGSDFATSFGGGGPSQQAQNLLQQRFPGQAGDPAQIVFTAASPLTTPANAAVVDHVVSAVRPLAHVSGVESPLAPAGHQLSRDGRTGFATVQFDTTAANLPQTAVSKVVAVAQSFSRPGFSVALGGAPIAVAVSASPGSSEGIGVTAAIIIMLVAFGSVVAMGLPVLTALAGVGIGFGVVDLVSHLITVPSFGPEMMAMIGLGVGIDYALFIVTRYRQGLTEGLSPRRAVVAAQATAGRAVAFAGTTVIISLLGLLIVGQAFMVGLAIGTILAVLVVLAGALSLLPAMLGFAGHAIDRLHLPLLLRTSTPIGHHGFWWRWSRTVQRRPWLAGGAALGVLVVLAVPLFSMHQAFSDASNDPPSLTTRQAYDALAQGFGPGFNGPLVIAAKLASPSGRATVVDLAGRLGSVPGVARVTPPAVNAGGDAAVIIVYPTTGPEAAATASLVHRLRDRVIPTATQGTGVQALIGGEAAAGVDASSALAARLPWVIALVIAVSFLLLMAVFRSVIIPIKAALMNLLSIGAAYGVIVAVYQWGWLGSVFGVSRAGPIDPWIPLMMFTITFGLSMDYEVFLLSRMREEWRRTGNNSMAVADGLASTGRVITAAAAIMVCVFGSFVIGDPLRVLDVFGLGLAAAIAVDATLVRMVLVPSLMQLVGRVNWWMPERLDQLVPTLGVESEPSPT